jgi:hypothetical protein
VTLNSLRTWRWFGGMLSLIYLTGNISLDRAQADGAPWLPPVNLGAPVNSSGDEQQVTITHSGLSLYFSSDRPGGFGNQDIWVSHRTGVQAPWGEPRNLGPNVNGPGQEVAPSFSPDDHWMFFPSGGRPEGFGSLDIYMTYRADVADDFGWQPAIHLGPSVNSPANDADPFYFVDPTTGEATLYFVSNVLGTFDIYESAQNADGSFRNAVLNKELSTAAYGDRHLTIRSDGLELIFTSDRPGGMGGLDLWVSTRNTTRDLWTEPVNLGSPVNSTFDDRGPGLSRDGLTLFFSSTRPGGSGNGDLWMTMRWPRRRWRWIPLLSRPSGQANSVVERALGARPDGGDSRSALSKSATHSTTTAHLHDARPVRRHS